MLGPPGLESWLLKHFEKWGGAGGGGRGVWKGRGGKQTEGLYVEGVSFKDASLSPECALYPGALEPIILE